MEEECVCNKIMHNKACYEAHPMTPILPSPILAQRTPSSYPPEQVRTSDERSTRATTSVLAANGVEEVKM